MLSSLLSLVACSLRPFSNHRSVHIERDEFLSDAALVSAEQQRRGHQQLLRDHAHGRSHADHHQLHRGCQRNGFSDDQRDGLASEHQLRVCCGGRQRDGLWTAQHFCLALDALLQLHKQPVHFGAVHVYHRHCLLSVLCVSFLGVSERSLHCHSQYRLHRLVLIAIFNVLLTVLVSLCDGVFGPNESKRIGQHGGRS